MNKDPCEKEYFKKIFEKCEENIYGYEICVYIYYLGNEKRSSKRKYLLYFINETFGEKTYFRKSISESEYMDIVSHINRYGVIDAYKKILYE